MPSTDFIDDTHYNEYSDDDDEPVVEQPLHIQDWMEYYSNDLLNMWMSIVAYREDTYLSNSIMNQASFADFCEFAYAFSDGMKSRRAT